MKTKLLADSSVWIDHLHKTDEEFGHALGARQIHVHQAVIGELACGTLARRADVLTRLMLLPELPDATFGELLALIDRRKLWGRGLSWVDVHLTLCEIRDLNDDLWKSPFDREFEAFVLEVKNLIVPILEAVQKYGLKKRHLQKYSKQIDQFYERVITDRTYDSDLTIRYQSRFKKYRQSLFTFIEHDGIPWNNNMAERAIRHLAVQRKISKFFFKSVAPQYLLMLGISQTCRFQEKSLLKFLLSGEKDIDLFKACKPLKRSVPVNPLNSPKE